MKLRERKIKYVEQKYVDPRKKIYFISYNNKDILYVE